jgi:glycosyltransferase involved in cell wall biosynthesis
MRYLVISPFFYPHIGGSQRYMEELYARIIKKHPTTKVDVLCYDTTGAPTKENHRGMTIYRVSCIEVLKGQFALPNPFELLGTLIGLSRYTYDVVHANTRFFDTSWWAWAYAWMIGAKSILTDHVASHPLHPKKTISRISKLIDLTIVRWILAQYDLITATNAKTQTFLIQTLKCTNVALMYGGVDTKFFTPARPSKSRSLPYIRKRFSNRHVIVTFAGRLIQTKGTLLFIEAIRQLLRSLPTNVSFVIAGGGDLKDTIAKTLSHAPLSKRVFMTGALYPQEVKQLLKATDIFVHPSYHAEGFPNAILEATASGCFVIATDNAGTKEIIDHKRTGLIIKQHDVQAIKRAIWWALIHSKTRKRMAQEARMNTVKQFDWNNQADNFLSLVHKLHVQPNHVLNTSIFGKPS